MKMLLTDAGIRNATIMQALLELLGKPISACDALCITTASYAHPMAGPIRAQEFVSGRPSESPMAELGWKSVGLLELTALPSLNPDLWVPRVQQADVLLVNGGDAMYLAHWMKESGLAAMLPDLDAVWVGLSAGSMVMTPRIGKEFVEWPTKGADDTALGVVDFAIFPHVDWHGQNGNTLEEAERWFPNIETPAYVIDNHTAIVVVDGQVEVVSEGEWRLFRR